MRFIDRDLWSEVMSTLSRNVLRTILTTLGVLFAIIILILLLGATAGMVNGFNKLFAGTATNSMFLWSQSTSMPYEGFDRGRRVELSLDDVDLIKQQVPEIDVVSPRIQLGFFGSSSSVVREGRTSESSVYGDYPSIDLVSKKNLVQGRFLNNRDIQDARKVCVIGQETYNLLFKKGVDPIGEYIQINGIFFSVVGVYKKNESIDFDGENSVFIPFTTFQKSFNSGNRIGWMAILIKEGHKVAPAEAKIKKVLKAKHKVHPKDSRAFGSFDFSQVFTGINAFTLVLQGFSFFIGIFTLLAGVIAISNILLITVKERTKEIGIRRALGATPKIIKKQIILESVVLTIFAGMIGFIISIGVLYFLDVKFGNSEDFPFVNPTVSIPQLIFSFTLMVGLSVLIGLIPANKAVKVKPIEALREE